MVERLMAAAIRRAGVVHTFGFREHWRIREALGDAEPHQRNMDDDEGFYTTEERFVRRPEALDIGQVSGQVRIRGRELLSSDIDWDAKPPKAEPIPRRPTAKRKKLLFRP